MYLSRSPERSMFGRGSTCSGNGYALPLMRSVSVVQVTSRFFCTASAGLRFTARWAGGAEMPVTAKRKGGVRLAW